MKSSANTTLKAGLQLLPEGIEITDDHVLLDGNNATIIGKKGEGAGIRIAHRKNVTIRNLNILGFRHGIFAEGCENLQIENVSIAHSDEFQHNSIFLDIFHETAGYPAGICLFNTANTLVKNCNLSHQLCGLTAYDCSKLKITDNTANYASGFGFYLSNTHDCSLDNNFADFCCRWHPQENNTGHMGADAAGFVIVNGSSRNTFSNNYARLGGDGFFLAGLRHDGRLAPCNENVFLNNDASWSPNISFEATFSSGNIFKGNKANNSNYGFWLGFSRSNMLKENDIHNNRKAGIAVENGIDMIAENNRLYGNGHGILLWSKRVPKFEKAVPENNTSKNWLIQQNKFVANGIAVKIAANQDHGIQPYAQYGRTPSPEKHVLIDNIFERNGKTEVFEGVSS